MVVEAGSLVGNEDPRPPTGAIGQGEGADHGATVGLVGDVAGGDHGRTVPARPGVRSGRWPSSTRRATARGSTAGRGRPARHDLGRGARGTIATSRVRRLAGLRRVPDVGGVAHARDRFVASLQARVGPHECDRLVGANINGSEHVGGHGFGHRARAARCPRAPGDGADVPPAPPRPPPAAILGAMRGKTGRRLQSGFPVAPAVLVALAALVVASCGSSPSAPQAGTPTTTHHTGPAPARHDDPDDDRHPGLDAAARVDHGTVAAGCGDRPPVLGRPRHRGREPRRRRVRRPAGPDQPVARHRVGRGRQRAGRHRGARADRHRRAGRRQHQLLRGDVQHRVRLRPHQRQPGRAVDHAQRAGGQQLRQRPRRPGGCRWCRPRLRHPGRHGQCLSPRPDLVGAAAPPAARPRRRHRVRRLGLLRERRPPPGRAAPERRHRHRTRARGDAQRPGRRRAVPRCRRRRRGVGQRARGPGPRCGVHHLRRRHPAACWAPTAAR